MMISGIRIVLQGLPERVQRAADALDKALPGLVAWHADATLGRGHEIRLEGFGVDRTDQPG